MVTRYKKVPWSNFGLKLIFNDNITSKLTIAKERRWFRKPCCFYKILINQAPSYFFSLLSPPPIGLIIHVSILKLDRFFAEQKLLVILFCLRQLKNVTNLIPQSVKLLHVQYFAKHFQTLSDQLQIAILEPMMFLV